MKALTRLTVATLAATLLLGAGASAAMAEDAPAPAVQQKSNVEPTLEMLTQEVFLSGATAARENLDVDKESSHALWPYESPYPASVPITAADGSLWRIVHAAVDSKYAKFWYISDGDVLSSAKAGTHEAAQKLVDAAAAAATEIHFEQFQGTGTVQAGASWYSSEDVSGSEPLAVASGLGFESEMSEPFENDAGVQVRKMSLYADGKYTTAHVPAADVINYTPNAEPTEEPTITASEEAPLEMPAAPEGMDGMAGTSIEGTEAGGDSPGNLGLMFGLGALTMAAGGGYLYWARRKGADGAADAEGEGLPKE